MTRDYDVTRKAAPSPPPPPAGTHVSASIRPAGGGVCGVLFRRACYIYLIRRSAPPEPRSNPGIKRGTTETGSRSVGCGGGYGSI